jgi:hypothetical protein
MTAAPLIIDLPDPAFWQTPTRHLPALALAPVAPGRTPSLA